MPSILLGSSCLFLTASVYQLLFCDRHCALEQGFCTCYPSGRDYDPMANPNPPLMVAGQDKSTDGGLIPYTEIQ